MDDKEVKEILELHKKWLNNDPCGRMANLYGSDLRGANLRGADLREAKLHEAKLHEAKLHGADLRGTDLHGADLRGTDLREAKLDYSTWPLWCGSLGVKVDDKIARQLAYHFCSLVCDDPEYQAARDAVKGFANGSHLINHHRLKEIL